MIHGDLETLQEEVLAFDGLTTSEDYQLRLHPNSTQFPDNLIGVYGAEAPKVYERWKNDAELHAVPGFKLTVIEDNAGL